jgi:hypothetical protein
MESESVALDARAQQRLYVLNHVLAGELSLDEAARVLRLSVRQVRGSSTGTGPLERRPSSTWSGAAGRPTGSTTAAGRMSSISHDDRRRVQPGPPRRAPRQALHAGHRAVGAARARCRPS